MTPSLHGSVTHFSANISSRFLILDPESPTRLLLSPGGFFRGQPILFLLSVFFFLIFLSALWYLKSCLPGIAPLCCVHSDGKNLASGGRSNLLHLWCLESRQLVRVIQMPSQVRTIRQLEFLPDSFDGGASQVHVSVCD